MMVGLVPLGQIAGNTGLIIDGDWVESKDQDPDGKVRLVQLADIGVGSFLDKSNRFMTGEKAAKLKCTYLEKGDILVARMPDPLGRACQFPGDQRKCVTVVDVCILRPDEMVANAAYVTHILNTDGVRRQLDKFIKGTTRQRISRTNLEQIHIPLPPVPEQRRIAAILDQADALRAKRREALAQLDRLTQSLFIEMFGDPVSNPRDWPLLSFEKVCPTRLGKMLDQKQQTGKHLRKYLRNANVQWFRFDLTDVLEMDFDDSSRGTFRLLNGDILICEGGEPGRAAIWRDEIAECYYQKALHRGRPNPELATPEYIVWLLWFLAARGGLSDHVTSATIAHLTGEKLKAMKIPVPSLSEQHEFVKLLNALMESRNRLGQSSTELDALFASLQHRAFRGEL